MKPTQSNQEPMTMKAAKELIQNWEQLFIEECAMFSEEGIKSPLNDNWNVEEPLEFVKRLLFAQYLVSCQAQKEEDAEIVETNKCEHNSCDMHDNYDDCIIWDGILQDIKDEILKS